MQKKNSNSGFSIVSTIIGLGLVVSAIYYFVFAYTNSQKSISKMEKLAFGKNFLTLKALGIQSFSLDEIVLATTNSNFDCDIVKGARPATKSEGRFLSQFRSWKQADEFTSYCIDVKNFDFKESNKILDVTLVGYFKPTLGKHEPLSYFVTFRKSR